MWVPYNQELTEPTLALFLIKQALEHKETDIRDDQDIQYNV